MSLFGPDKQAPTFYELAFSLIVIFSDLVLTGDTGSPLHFVDWLSLIVAFLFWCLWAAYNYTSVHCVPLVLVRRMRLRLPDLTWRRRSHSRSYTTNCPNFNLGAIVCEPAYDSSFALIGLGHKQGRPYIL